MASLRVVAGGVSSGFVTGVALVLGLLLRERWTPPPTEPPAVRAVSTHDGAHLAIPGRAVTLKAILTPLPGHLLRYAWEFGDGQVSPQAPVTDPHAVEARHHYVACAPGARYEARLRVLDTTSGLEGVAAYPVEFVAPDVETLSAVMLDDALWALHRSMRRTDDPLHGKLGHWSAPREESSYRHGYPVGGTALATLAFVVNGFDLRPERADHPYTETVERGLDFLAATLTEQELAKEPITDHGGNGRGLTTGSPRPGYEVPMTAMAFIGAQAPGRRCGGANPLTSGRTARDVVGDLLDTIHAHQRLQGPAAGGWRYSGRGRDADLSVTQFAALALHAAETVWNTPTPPRVKTALEGYLAKATGAKGGFSYQPGRGETVSMTGAGVIALACAGVSSSDPRAERARDFIGADWARENVGDGYAMYTVMKAARLGAHEVTRFGGHDWRQEYVLHLARTQREDGAWKDDGRWGQGTLATVWPALTLSKDVLCSAAPLRSRSIAWQVAGAAAAGVVGAGCMARRLLRRRPGR